MQLSVFTSDTPLSKTFRRGQDGSLEKLAGGKLVRGFVKREAFLDLEGFSKFISGLNGVNALAYGIPKHDEARVLSRKESGSEKGGDLPVIHRTRESFTWPQGEGVFMLDHDVRKDRSVILSQEELLGAITKACPALSSAPMLLTHSASSHIYEDGKLIQGQAGMRIYVRVKDATDIPRAGAALYKRLWLAGFGFIEIGQSGAIYERSLIDASVWTPERLDFAGGAHCEPPYSQCRPDHVLLNEDFEAEAFDTTLIKDLTEREEERFKNLVWNARQQSKDKADQKRSEWLLSLPDDRRNLVDASMESGTLPADFVLTSVNGEEFTVKEALADKEKYHGIYVQHPFEPDYQPDNEKLAQLKLDSNPRPCVHTFAHGGQNFWLDTAEVAFDGIEPPAETMEYPEPGPQKIQVIAKRLIRSEIDLRAITPRQWILGTRYIRQFVTLLVAPGGGSKSTLAMTELLSVALNRELTGEKVHVPGPVWIMNSEDPEDEVHRRLRAILDHFKIDVDADYPNIHVTGSEFDFCLAEENKRGKVTINHHAIEPIEAYIRENGIVLWTLDPWVRAHQVGENDNNGIDALMKEVAGICRRTNSACSIIHHTRKGGDIAGNMDAIRGASSLVSAARIADTLTVMSEKEAKRLGVNEKRRRHYVRIDGAKANLRPPAEDTSWFERIDVRLETGDHIGVLQPCEFDEVEEVDDMTRNITEFLALEMSPGDRMSVNQAAELLVEKYGSRLVDEKGKTPAVRTLAGYIMKAYEVPVEVGRLQIRYVNEKIKGSNGCHFLSAKRVELDEL